MEPEKQDWAMKQMELKWRPSIHMPREAARLFLRVTGVRVERLQETTPAQAVSEGCTECANFNPLLESRSQMLLEPFMKLWNSTVKPAYIPRYGWEANPWVWVIEFERISKEAALGGGRDD